ncbi:MAG: type VI secretion system tube protein Hcp [Vicinamibacterales bacterium]
MPVEAFIKFTAPTGANTPVPVGASGDVVFKDYARLTEFSFGIENQTTIGSATGGAGAGRAQFREFTIRRTTDPSSNAIYRNCAAGAHYGLVTIVVRQVGSPGGKPHIVYNFGMVFTVRIEYAGPGDEGPEEVVTFAYGALSIATAKQLPDGRLEPLKNTDWNQVTNTPTFTTQAALLTF